MAYLDGVCLLHTTMLMYISVLLRRSEYIIVHLIAAVKSPSAPTMRFYARFSCGWYVGMSTGRNATCGLVWCAVTAAWAGGDQCKGTQRSTHCEISELSEIRGRHTASPPGDFLSQ